MTDKTLNKLSQIKKVRKRTLLLIVIAFLIIHSLFAQDIVPVIPLPDQYTGTTDTFYLSPETTIEVPGDGFLGAEYLLKNQLLKYTGWALTKKEGSSSIILKKEDKMRKEGAYRISMNPRQVVLSAADEEGMRNAVSTLVQLAIFSDKKERRIAIRNWNISDRPLYGWRGFMLDESRHFFGKEEVEKIMDQMFLLKLNKFHWHLTDEPGWRIEIKQYQKLAFVGGVGNYTDSVAPTRYYSQDDIRAIVAFAAERGIEIIPELDMPGHATAANRAYPEYSGGWARQNPHFTFNPGKEDTYSYLTNILKEFAILFPSGKIHLGGDEVSFGIEAWNDRPEVKDLMKGRNLKDLKEVEHYFFQRMSDSALHLFDKLMAWDEAADSDMPTDSTIIYWWRHDKPEQLNKALDKGFKVILSPRIPLYLDFVQDSSHWQGRRWKEDFASVRGIYDFTNQTYRIDHPSLVKNVLGLQANLWSERVASTRRLEFMIFPRLAALSEAAWTSEEDRNYGSFLKRLARFFPLYKREGIYYFDPLDKGETPEVVDFE